MKKNILLFVFVCLNLAFAGAQSRTTDSLTKAVKTARTDTARVNTLNRLSRALAAEKKFDQGLEKARQALQLSQKVKFAKGQADSYNALGYLHAVQAHFPEAMESYTAALEINRTTGNQTALVTSHKNIGLVYYRQGDFPQAIVHARARLDLLKESGDQKALADAYIDLGNIHYEQGDFAEAMKQFENVLATRKAMGDKAGIADAYNNIGTIHNSLGNMEEAVQSFFASLKMREEIGNKEKLGDSYNNLGVLYSIQGNFPEALKYHEQGLKIKLEVGDKNSIADSYLNIGNVYSDQENTPEALKYYKKALEMYLEDGDQSALADCYNNIGNMHHNMENYDEAIANYTASLNIKEKTGDRAGMSSTYSNLGGVYFDQGNPNEALVNFKKAIAIQEEIGDKRAYAYTYNAIGQANVLYKNPVEGKKWLLKGLKASQEMGMLIQVKSAASFLVKAYMQLGQTDSAAVYLMVLKEMSDFDLNTNYFLLSEQEKELYFKSIEGDYGLYYEFVDNHYKTHTAYADTAYGIALTNKGLALKSVTAMRRTITASGDTSLTRLYQDWLDLKKGIAELYQYDMEDKELESQANALEKELVKRSVAFSNFGQVKNMQWQQVQAKLKEGEAAIEFVHYTGADTSLPVLYMAMIIKKESTHPDIVHLFNQNELEKLLGLYQGNNLDFVNAVYGTRQKPATGLYAKIWQPLEPYLQGIQTVYYSPSGLLHKISFAGLGKDPHTNLSDIYNLYQVSSTGNLVHSPGELFNNTDALMLVGGVEYNSPGTQNAMWTYLPGTLSEIKSIATLMEKKKINYRFFSSAQASEEIVKKEAVTSSILHISTHGYFYPDPEKVALAQQKKTVKEQDIAFRGNTAYAELNFVKNKNPLMRSGLILAGANQVWERENQAGGEDGILTAQEVTDLNLAKTKLVVLSACETGLGDIKGSEGVYGLQRAFKMAGAHYLVMSLWQVPDKETSEFMQLFYKNMIGTNDIKNAFAQAQTSMRKKYDPYYWAAFVLVD